MNTKDIRRIGLVVALLVCIFTATGCGQKGPLYLPDKEEPPRKDNR